jgi:hypothetical protein
MGYGAGLSNTTGHDNTFSGYCAGLANTTGNGNTFQGFSAGISNTSGYANTFIGSDAGNATITGFMNTFLGSGAGSFNTGSHNTFLGYQAGVLNSAGHDNTYVGDNAGGWGTSGYENTCIGVVAGGLIGTGHSNVFIGYQAGFYESTSNKLYIANNTTSYPLIYGDFSANANYLVFGGKVGINGAKTAPTHLLDVGTSGAYCDGGAWVDGSSREYKENIQTLTTEKALKAFQGLEPVEYNYKADREEKYLGFIAEDVPELVATKDRKGLSPMDVVAVLTKVVQEQQKTISELRERMAKLERKGKAGK